MLIIISPAKTLDFDTDTQPDKHTIPEFLEEAKTLVLYLRDYDTEGLERLMNISPALAQLNFERYLKWQTPFTTSNAKQNIFVFRGEAYRGIDIDNWREEDIINSQDYLRILSGLYGILRPLDLIQPYRLEMGTSFETSNAKNLYEFWGNKITLQINSDMENSKGEKVLINLASNEYFKAINKKELKYNIITPVFKEQKGDKYKTIAVYAKRARGLMTRFIIENKIETAENIKAFDKNGYAFNADLSKKNQWVFTR